MARKTYAVEDLKTKVNHMLASSAENGLPEESRVSLYAVLESVLFDTDNYKGFRFTDGSNGDVDRTRRHYY